MLNEIKSVTNNKINKKINFKKTKFDQHVYFKKKKKHYLNEIDNEA